MTTRQTWRAKLANATKRLTRATANAKKARADRRKAKAWLKAHPVPVLRLRAYKVAQGLVGVMEQGGNNTGPTVDKIIRANGGAIGEPWCGDFVAYCYRNAGSKSVQRAWASVRALRGLVGVQATARPQTGDLVRYTFDHVGMFVKDRGDGTILTIEGNTGSSGAQSDSRTGGDGVYLKVRPKSLVADYLAITR